jgi:flagellar hook-associated protein 2
MSPSTINFGGLASGLDTNTIVDQLIALERRPQARLKLQQSALDARKTALGDVLTRLKNLKLAAADLRSPVPWAPAQSVEVSDPTKLAATRTGGAATGGYQVAIEQLASASRHWFTYTPPESDETLSVKGHAVPIPAGTDIDTVASALNSDPTSPVYASVVTVAGDTKQLVLSSRATGAGSDFTVTGSAVEEDADRAVAGGDSRIVVGGKTYERSSNSISDVIPGVQLQLKGITTSPAPLSVVIGAPLPDQAQITARARAFVEQYNSTTEFIRSKLEEKPVSGAATATDAGKGRLYGDSMLQAVLSQLRGLVSGFQAAGNPEGLDQLAEAGISTGASTGGGALNQDAIRGKLSFDATKFADALAAHPAAVRALLASADQALESILDPVIGAGGTLDTQVQSHATQRKRLQDQIDQMDRQLTKRQETLKRQFTAMESSMQGSQAQQQWLTGQLSALKRS